MKALLENLNYEQGCNPVNVTYQAGMGWKRQNEMVDQYAQNCERQLPPTGLPVGNLQSGFGWTDVYQKEPEELTFPSDGADSAPYPVYDRWSDSFNLAQEFVIVNQARSLAYLAWLMAQTPLKSQPWKSDVAQIVGISSTSPAGSPITVTLATPGLDSDAARIIWEAKGAQPTIGNSFTFIPTERGPHWIEAEAQWPDGRRVFGMTNFTVK